MGGCDPDTDPRPRNTTPAGAVVDRDTDGARFDWVAGMASSYLRAWMALGQSSEQTEYHLLYSLPSKRLNSSPLQRATATKNRSTGDHPAHAEKLH
jgi:hypothetical protein